MWERRASFDLKTRSEWALASTYRALRSRSSSASPGRRVNLSVPVWQLAIYWSALLAVVYMAARSSVRRIGYRLRDTLLSTSAPVEEDTQRLKREEELGKFLGLNRSYVEELQSAFSVLTPLAGAAASHLACKLHQ